MQKMISKLTSIKLFLTLAVAGALFLLINLKSLFLPKSVFNVKLLSSQDVSENTSFSCKSLAYAGLFGVNQDEKLEGEMHEGSDQIAMNIKDDKTLTFLTSTSLKAGVAEGDDFLILENNKEKLLAIWHGTFHISTITINKKSGFAVWLKGSPDFIGSDIPSGQIIYLSCR